jgi:hypothetical protein
MVPESARLIDGQLDNLLGARGETNFPHYIPVSPADCFFDR